MSDVKAGVLQAARRGALGRRRVARAAERARRSEARIVEQDQHVWRALWRSQRRDRRELRVRVLGIVSREAHVYRRQLARI